AVEDKYGNVVTTGIYENTNITLALNNPAVSVTGSLTSVVHSGQATFTGLTLTTAGVYTFNATDGSLFPATSRSFTISAAAAAKLAFLTSPGNTVSTSNLSPFTVAVEDAYGNIATTDTSTITLTSSTNPSSFGPLANATHTLVAADNGEFTFSS